MAGASAVGGGLLGFLFAIPRAFAFDFKMMPVGRFRLFGNLVASPIELVIYLGSLRENPSSTNLEAKEVVNAR
jgi:hypothetical protein